MTKDEALKLAMEAMEITGGFDVEINAIKEALAQPEPWEKFCDSNCVWTDHHPDCKLAEQEPVATDWERIARVQDAKLRAMCNEAGGFEKLCEVMDKYERTTPPQRTSRSDIKPLTDEEIKAIFESNMKHDISDAFGFARAIEAAHGIKGEA